jgi:hypothetical protein
MNITMGYPAGKIARDPKAARLAEAFGIQDMEAWEDYGRVTDRRRGGDDSEDEKGSVAAKSERSLKAASVWDMEATLQAGCPVASGPPVPPVPTLPVLPTLYNGLTGSAPRSPNLYGNDTGQPSPTHLGVSGTNGDDPYMPPKRTKSLVAKFKKGVKAPNVPLVYGDEDAPPAVSGDDEDQTRGALGRHHSSKSLGGLRSPASPGAGPKSPNLGGAPRTGWRDDDEAAAEKAVGNQVNAPVRSLTRSRKASLLHKIGLGKRAGR